MQAIRSWVMLNGLLLSPSLLSEDTIVTHLRWTVLHLCLLICARLSAASPATAEQASFGWDQLPTVLAQIEAPQFPERDFSIAEQGAIADGKTDCLPVLTAAIAACSQAGGGRVIVPEGDWFVAGPIHLLSNVNLHLAKEATLHFSTDAEDYLPTVFTRFEGTEIQNYSPLVYAFEQENIAITGEGTLDGQADDANWWPWTRHRGELVEGSQDQRLAVARLYKLVDEGVGPEKRVFGKGYYLRPNFVQPYRCKNVLIEGITVVNSPMWDLHPVLCENVTVRDVKVNSHGPNNDGCNPECCRNVLIEGCQFDTGDDCIAIKSGRNADGRRVGRPSENIVVRNCQMKDGHGGVVLGSEMSGGVQNVFVEDCKMDSPHLERAIRLKSNSLRGGYLENLCVRNIEVGQVKDAVIRINLDYFNEQGDYPPTVRNVFLENITAEKSKMSIYFVGLPEQPIENVRIKNCTFRGAAKPSVLEHVHELDFEDVAMPR